MSLNNKVATGGNSGIDKAMVLESARRDAGIVIDYMPHPLNVLVNNADIAATIFADGGIMHGSVGL